MITTYESSTSHSPPPLLENVTQRKTSSTAVYKLYITYTTELEKAAKHVQKSLTHTIQQRLFKLPWTVPGNNFLMTQECKRVAYREFSKTVSENII